MASCRPAATLGSIQLHVLNKALQKHLLQFPLQAFNTADFAQQLNLNKEQFYCRDFFHPVPSSLQPMSNSFALFGFYHLLLKIEPDLRGLVRCFWLATNPTSPVINNDYINQLDSIDLFTKKIGREFIKGERYFNQLPLLGSQSPLTFQPEKIMHLVFSEGLRLTERQKLVIRHLFDGLKNSEIAQVMGISLRGVENHLAAIKSKFYCERKAEILHYLLRHKKVSWR